MGTMPRWAYVLLALIYLLPQAGLALHHEEAESCAACPSGPVLECAGCEDDSHHHHDQHLHHPGSCRTCSAADVAAFDAPSTELSIASVAFAARDVAPSSSAAHAYERPIRAPPAA